MCLFFEPIQLKSLKLHRLAGRHNNYLCLRSIKFVCFLASVVIKLSAVNVVNAARDYGVKGRVYFKGLAIELK